MKKELLTKLLNIEFLDPALLVAYFYRRNSQYRLLDLILANAGLSLYLKIAQDTDFPLQLPNLKVLKIAGNLLTELNFKLITHLPHLKQIVVDKYQILKLII